MKHSPPPSNLQIAKLLRSVAAALELDSDNNRFRVVAYQRAADSVEHATSDLKDLWDEHRISELPGVGENITQHLDELFKTGKVSHFEAILKPYPQALFELMEIPGLGPKRALALCRALGISKAHTAVKELEKAVKKGHVAKIEGFGTDLEAQIKRNIAEYRRRSGRLLLSEADLISSDLIDWLNKNPVIEQADVLGSLRRRSATVGDIDISVSTSQPESAIRHFCAYPKITRVIEAGVKTATIMLRDHLTVDLMTGRPEEYGSLLQHFTGSKLHNIALREIANQAGYSLSEYGVRDKDKIISFTGESQLYNFFHLQYIPPELREGNEELSLAKTNSLPELIKPSDIKGDLQIHSNIDTKPSHDLGTDSIQTLASSAKTLGYEYIGLTEHNPAFSLYNVSQIENIIKRKTDLIRKFNADNEKSSENLPYVFNGLEIDIRSDGQLAFPENLLNLLDYAGVSIHSSFRQNKSTTTSRILSGLNHPKVKFLAHPSGRLIGSREGIQADWDIIFSFCRENGKWLEINSFPNRLDLPDFMAKEAVANGVDIVINTDSHSAHHLPYIRYGVDVARRAYLTKTSVVNTMPFAKLVKILKKEVS